MILQTPQRDLNLGLRRGLRNRRVSDVANLAGAMIFVVGVPVEVADNLHAQHEHRQNQRRRSVGVCLALFGMGKP